MNGGSPVSIRITHIRLTDGIRDHQHISHVKYLDNSGNPDSRTKALIVDWIDNKNGAAYVGTGSQQVRVLTVHPDQGAPYLRTHADGRWTNNLLSLPTF